MTTYISLLRGINVGGNKKIKMEALRQLYVELGLEKVKNYIQSGNMVFATENDDLQALEQSISVRIREVFGFDVRVLVLPATEFKKAVENHPFIADSSKDRAYLHLTFLSKIPDSLLLEKISTTDFMPDEFQCSGNLICLYCPTGYGNTKLTNSFWESKLKLTATTRNLRTCYEIIALSESISPGYIAFKAQRE